MLVYRMILALKMLGALAFAGGLVATFTSESPEAAKRATHRVASPALLVVWGCGVALCLLGGTPIGELWILGGLALSLASQLALVVAASRGPSRATLAAAVAPLVATVLLMVFRPTWSEVL